MRITVILDADVEQLPRDAMQRRRQSLRARRMGLRAGIDSAQLNQVADELEAEGFEELSRRLVKAQGKYPSRKRP